MSKNTSELTDLLKNVNTMNKKEFRENSRVAKLAEERITACEKKTETRKFNKNNHCCYSWITPVI